MKDAGSMNFEYGICRDLCLEIDSEAGKATAIERKMKLMEEYFRKPPKTRTNFIKLATPFPFSVDWDRLSIDWIGKSESGFTVLRDKKMLSTLCEKKQNVLPDVVLSQPYLVPVTVRVKHGSPQEFSMICLPSADDKVNSIINEPIHQDPCAKERKVLRQQHSSLLKNLAKKRKEFRDKEDKTEDFSSATAIAIHKEKMRSLWLPSSCNLKTSFARPVMGFITQGDFGLSEGKGIGRGFIVIHAISQIPLSRVLVRNPGTNLYMWAEITFE